MLTKKQIDKFNKSRINDSDKAYDYYVNVIVHSEALTMHEAFKVKALFDAMSNKERNAEKRAQNTLKTLSTFCKSAKIDCQAFRIDEALTDYHTMTELLNLSELKDCKESRIKSHISFLQHNFRHVCKYVIEDDSKRVKRFKFELIV